MRLCFPKDPIWSALLEDSRLSSVDFRLCSDWKQSVGTPEMLTLKKLEMHGVSTNMGLGCMPKRGFRDFRDCSRTFNEPIRKEVKYMDEEMPVDALVREMENGLRNAVDEHSKDVVEDEAEDYSGADSEDSSDADAYVHHSFASDTNWEAKWRVFLQRLHGGLGLSQSSAISTPTDDV